MIKQLDLSQELSLIDISRVEVVSVLRLLLTATVNCILNLSRHDEKTITDL